MIALATRPVKAKFLLFSRPVSQGLAGYNRVVTRPFFTAAISLLFVALAAASKTDKVSTELGASPAEKTNQLLQTGFNLGNTFDFEIHSTSLKDISPVIDLYSAAGMRHVRIPVTWGNPIRGNTLCDEQGAVNLNNPRTADLIQAVDYALKKGLFVIVNTHHEHWLKESYDGSSKYNQKFTKLWTGIAKLFKDRSPKLIFEILNEPEKAFGDWTGPVKPFDSTALALTRQINEIGVKAVRKVSPTRIVMVGTNGQGNHSMLDDVYPDAKSLPGGGKDKHLIATVHTYDPWPFCGQDGSNAKWPGDDAISAPIKAVAAHGRKIGIPINYGEFGVGRTTGSERDTDLVRGYYRLVRKTALSEGMSVTPWDDRGWFGLVARDPGGKFRLVHNIVPSMMKD
jgi:endoglucanase